MGKVGKGKVTWTALLTTVILLCTGCSQEVMDRMTEAVIEQARENAELQNAQQSQETGTSGNVGGGISQSRGAEQYAYHSLNPLTQKVYDEIYETVMDFEDTVELSTTDENVLEQAYYAVMADHGGIFWVEGYSYTEYTRNSMTTRMEFHPQYSMDESTRNSYQHQVDRKVEDILRGISATASDYEKAKYVYETLASTVTYQEGSQNNQNILSVFINGVTVCQGYASAAQYLLSQLGVTCTIVIGTASGGPHAWNLVCLDGNYYYMDVTWGSSSYHMGASGKGYVDFSYFAVTSQELFQTHAPTQYYPLPVCDHTEDSYYTREQLYYTEWDLAAIEDGIQAQTGTSISMKFATDDLYEKAFSYFIEDGHLWEYMDSSSVYYMENSQMRVLTIFR